MGAERGQGLGALRLEHLAALDQGTPRLHQVVHDDDVLPLRLALLQRHESLVALPHLGADNLLEPLEEGVEPLHRALVGVGDHDVVLVGEPGDLLQQQRDARLEARRDVVAEIKPLLQSVNVEDDGARGSPAGHGDVREHAREGHRCGYLALALHALGGARGEEGQDERERRDEHLWEGVDD